MHGKRRIRSRKNDKRRNHSRWGDLNDDFYPCNKCIHGVDKREDFWQYAEEVEDGMENEKFQKKMVTWNIGDKDYESTVICNDERSFKAICGLLEKENLTPLIRNIYTIYQGDEDER